MSSSEDVSEQDERDIERQKNATSAEMQARQDTRRHAQIRQLFSGDETARALAILSLKEAWGHDNPAFNEDELANFHPQAATTMAAKRDGWKEVINWLIQL